MCMCQAYRLEPEPVHDPKGLERVMRAAGELVSPRVTEAVANEMRYYLWKYKHGSKRIGACSKCKARTRLPNDQSWKHGAKTSCPACGHEVVVKDIGRGRKQLYQDFYIAEWRKSEAEGGALVMVGAYCSMDSRGYAPEDAVPQITPISICVYRYGKDAVCFKRRVWEYDYEAGSRGPGRWERRRKCTPLDSSQHMVMPKEWFRDAIQGTRFETVWALLPTPTRYARGDITSEMEAIAKKPYIEYLAKMGLTELAWEATQGALPRGAINPRGKNAQQILGLNGQQLREIKQDGLQLRGIALGFARKLYQAGIAWKVRDIIEGAATLYSGVEIMPLLGRFPADMREKAIRYAIKTIKKPPQGLGAWTITSDLRDYWKQLGELNADMRDEQIVFPKDLQAAHIEATARVKIKADPKLDGMIQERAKRLRPLYTFEHGGLMMWPFTQAGEVIREGNALRHCVGRYVEGYANGNTILCALRRAEAPDLPFRTVEFSAREGRMIQCRGFKNQSPTEEQPAIDAFFAAWRAEKIDKKKEKKTA